MFLNTKELELLRNYIYTNYSDLDEELKQRKKNIKLKKAVEKFWGNNKLTEIVSNEPRAVLSRAIFTPNLEFEYFIDVIKDFNLKPLLLEYQGKFVAKNLEKYHLCRMFFREKAGKHGTLLMNSKNIVDFNITEGKDFSSIHTHWEENVVDFHHRLLEFKYPGMTKNIVNFTEWFNKTRYLTEHYYFYFFSLFLYHGVLFENFLIDDKEESIFLKDHVFSSFEAVHEYFGVKPLIFSLLPIENEKFRTWFSYSPSVKSFIDNGK